MLVNEDTLLQAKEAALKDADLEKALRDWFHMKGQNCAAVRDLAFDDWLHEMLSYSSTYIDCVYNGHQGVSEIVSVLRINAMGDPLALRLTEAAKEDGFSYDTNCYVEDGMVYSEVYVSNADPEKSKKKADAIAESFRSQGYSAETWIDEEDEQDVTVNAVLDFTSYLARITPVQ